MKAYDIKVLLEKLKARGLDLAEDGAKIVIEETCDWVAESATLSPNVYDDVLVIAIPAVKKFALEQADKIDGKEG